MNGSSRRLKFRFLLFSLYGWPDSCPVEKVCWKGCQIVVLVQHDRPLTASVAPNVRACRRKFLL